MVKKTGSISVLYQSRFKNNLKIGEIKRLINSIFLKENQKLKSLNIILCTDEYLLKINQDFLKHNFYTDVITFNYSNNKEIEGEIFISFQRLIENSTSFNVHPDMELLRLIIHGVLHLCGYSDNTIKEKVKMSNLEDFYLKCKNN